MAHHPILKRTGITLAVVGIIDIAVMLYCIFNQISYSSSLNIFAVIAGLFLIRGNLRAASIVRWFAIFLLGSFLSFILVWPFIYSADLMLTQVRLNPLTSVISVAFIAGVLLLLLWLQRQLGLAPVLAARALVGRKVRDMRIPATIGVCLAAFLAVFLSFLMNGESATKAKSIAKDQLGPAYQYHVSSLNIRRNNHGTFVAGVVTAWNDQQVLNIPVAWKN
jgi:hypothetical protein